MVSKTKQETQLISAGMGMLLPGIAIKRGWVNQVPGPNS
jgi:hypothetical protein